MVRGFQNAVIGLRYSPVPVVVAPAGLTLGGGCELVLHGDRVQAAAETYLGQAEVGVGLIPAGCGTKELTVRAIDATMPGTDSLPRLQRAFETIGFGKVSTSAAHARQLGLIRDIDGVTMDRERLMADAKAVVVDRVRQGYRAPDSRTAIPVGGEDVRAALELGIHLAWRGGGISDHDARIGRALARIMTGGDLPSCHDGDRAVPAGPGARGVSRSVRRAEDPGAHSSYAQDRQAAPKLGGTRSRPHQP